MQIWRCFATSGHFRLRLTPPPPGFQGCARFAENLSELTKTWSSGATECGVWIGNCNVKVWKSTEHKLYNIWRSVQFLGCARFPVFVKKYFEFHILWSLSSVDFFLSQSNFQFQLEFNLRFVVVLDTLPWQWCRNIFLKIDF